MRTTLDIDDRVLAAARSRARVRGISLGRALSEFALVGLAAEEGSAQVLRTDGFPMLPPVPGHVITDEMVEAALAENV